MTDETKKAATNAKEEQGGASKAKNEATNEGGALGSAESRKASAATGKSPEKTSEENQQTSAVPQEAGGSGPDKSDADTIAGLNAQIATLQADLNNANGSVDAIQKQNEKLAKKLADLQDIPEPTDEGDESTAEILDIDFRIRGLLMAIIIKLPVAARYRSDVDQLDTMVQFLNSFETADERIVVVELIKSIGEVDMNKIASGAYTTDVAIAMSAIRGEVVSVDDIRSADSQQAASDRLQMAFSGGRMPELPEAARQGLIDSTKPRKDPTATAEQNAAADRLYGASGKK